MTTPKATPRLRGEDVWLDELVNCASNRDKLRIVLRAFNANARQQRLAALGSEGPVTPPAPGEELGTCDLVSRPHPRNCCGEAWRALAAPPVTAPANTPQFPDATKKEAT